MASVDIVGSLYKALENSWPIVAVAIAAVAVVSPLTIVGYAYISQNPVLLPIACGLAVGVCSMATMKYSGAQRSKSRKEKAETVFKMSLLDRPTIESLMDKDEIPGWVQYPKYEKVAWLNRELTKAWPYINRATSKMLSDTLTPILEAYKVGIISGIEVESITLGTLAPKLNGVRTYKSGEDEITLEAKVLWSGGDQKVILSVGIPGPNFPIKVSDIKFTGDLKVVFKPLMGELPGFGAILFAFSEEPHIEMNISLLGGSIAMVPGLLTMVDNIIKTAVADMLVWPSRMVFPMVTGDFSYLNLTSCGYLNIVLIEGTRLPKTDLISRSDPFVYLYVRQRKDIIKRSSVKQNNQEPVWNEQFYLEVEDMNTQKLTVRVMDDEMIEKSEYMGSRHLELKDMTPYELQDLWVELVMDPAAPEVGHKRGLIHLNVTYIPYETEDEKKNSPALKKPEDKTHGDGFAVHQGQDDHHNNGLTAKVKQIFGFATNEEKSGPVDVDKIVGNGDLEEHKGGRIKKSEKASGTGF